MPINWEERSGDSKYVYLPKVGETKTFKIKTCREVREPGSKFNFKAREKMTFNDGSVAIVEKDSGFRLEFILEDDRILTVNSWKPYYGFRNLQVNDGDTIIITHKDKGEWLIRRGA